MQTKNYKLKLAKLINIGMKKTQICRKQIMGHEKRGSFIPSLFSHSLHNKQSIKGALSVGERAYMHNTCSLVVFLVILTGFARFIAEIGYVNTKTLCRIR